MNFNSILREAGFGIFLLMSGTINITAQSQSKLTYKLIWSEEFNHGSVPDSTIWNYEYGFQRNHEEQWYQPENARIENGCLVLEARKEKFKNPRYVSNHNSWKFNREFVEYTSASINTKGKFSFCMGRLEVSAKLDTAMGLWPAIWTLGNEQEWPSNGEIDVMEYYPINDSHSILANVAHGSDKRYQAVWNSKSKGLNELLKNDPKWSDKFHIWRMDWDQKSIRLYLDNELLNEELLENTLNPDGFQPFMQPHYILLNLALGGDHGGELKNTRFPSRYLIDYVRVYQLR